LFLKVVYFNLIFLSFIFVFPDCAFCFLISHPLSCFLNFYISWISRANWFNHRYSIFQKRVADRSN